MITLQFHWTWLLSLLIIIPLTYFTIQYVIAIRLYKLIESIDQSYADSLNDFIIDMEINNIEESINGVVNGDNVGINWTTSKLIVLNKSFNQKLTDLCSSLGVKYYYKPDMDSQITVITLYKDPLEQ